MNVSNGLLSDMHSSRIVMWVSKYHESDTYSHLNMVQLVRKWIHVHWMGNPFCLLSKVMIYVMRYYKCPPTSRCPCVTRRNELSNKTQCTSIQVSSTLALPAIKPVSSAQLAWRKFSCISNRSFRYRNALLDIVTNLGHTRWDGAVHSSVGPHFLVMGQADSMQAMPNHPRFHGILSTCHGLTDVVIKSLMPRLYAIGYSSTRTCEIQIQTRCFQKILKQSYLIILMAPLVAHVPTLKMTSFCVMMALSLLLMTPTRTNCRRCLWPLLSYRIHSLHDVATTNCIAILRGVLMQCCLDLIFLDSLLLVLMQWHHYICWQTQIWMVFSALQSLLSMSPEAWVSCLARPLMISLRLWNMNQLLLYFGSATWLLCHLVSQ